MSLFTFRVSKTEAAVFVVYVALVLAYYEYVASERQARAQSKRQARAQSSMARELRQLNEHIEDFRDQDPEDEFEKSERGCGC